MQLHNCKVMTACVGSSPEEQRSSSRLQEQHWSALVHDVSSERTTNTKWTLHVHLFYIGKCCQWLFPDKIYTACPKKPMDGPVCPCGVKDGDKRVLHSLALPAAPRPFLIGQAQEFTGTISLLNSSHHPATQMSPSPVQCGAIHPPDFLLPYPTSQVIWWKVKIRCVTAIQPRIIIIREYRMDYYLWAGGWGGGFRASV